MMTSVASPAPPAASASNKKRPLEDVSNSDDVVAAAAADNTSTKKAKKAPAVAKKPKKAKTDTAAADAAKLEKAANGVIRKIQGQINSRLKWKNSYKAMKYNSDITKGGRVEVPCASPEIFEKIFSGISATAPIKSGKDGKLSVAFKDEDQVSSLPLHGKSYRYNSAELRAPCTATYKEHAVTFSFKFCIW